MEMQTKNFSNAVLVSFTQLLKGTGIALSGVMNNSSWNYSQSADRTITASVP